MQTVRTTTSIHPGGPILPGQPTPYDQNLAIHALNMGASPTAMFGAGQQQPPEATAVPMRNPFENWKGEMMSRSVFRGMLAELLGTTTFLTLAVGAATVMDRYTAGYPAAKVLSIGLSLGLAYFFAGLVFGQHSYGLFNPAFALGLFCVGRLSFVRMFYYVVAELVGACAAGGLLYACLPAAMRGSGAQALLPAGVTWGAALAAEIILTYFLGAALASMLTDLKQRHRALLPGVMAAGLAACALLAYAVSGAALNPVRSLASGVLSGVWGRYHWINWLGPMIGAPLGVALHTALFAEMLKDKESGRPFQAGAETTGYQAV